MTEEQYGAECEVMRMVQRALFQYILQPLSGLKSKIPDRVWQVVIALAVFGMQMYQFASAMGIISRYIVECICFCVLLGLIIVAGLSKNMQPLKPAPGLWICWFGIVLLMLLTGVLIERNVLAETAIRLVALPLFFVVWGNRKLEDLVKPVACGVYLGFAVFCLICAVNYPIAGDRYKSFYENQNSLGLYCAAVYVIAVADLFSQKKFSWRSCVATFAAGFAAALLLYSNVRGGQLAAIISTVVAVGLSVVVNGKQFWKSMLMHVLPLVIAAAIAIPGCVHVFSIGFNLKNGHILQNKEPETTETTTIPTELSTTPSTEAPTAPSTEAPTAPPADEVLKNILDKQGDRMNLISGGINTFTSGRIRLWKAYWKELGFLGHREDHQVFLDDGKATSMSSHLTLLQISYEYGALTGVFFLMFNLIAGIKALIYAIKHRMDKYATFPVLVSVGYGVMYLVEWIFSPVGSVLTFAYLIVQVPFMHKKSAANELE